MARLAVAALAAALSVVLCSSASAARLVTWTTTTRYVDPRTQTFVGPPARPSPSLLPVDVYLPDGYDGRRRFPVLYLLHGHGDNYSSWTNPSDGDLRRVARGLRAIVVMPEADQGWYADWWNGGARAMPAWESYHLDQLIPLAERRLRILPGRRNHAIAGPSMGGEGAVLYAAERPGYFGAVASFSGSLSIQRPEWPAALGSQGQSYGAVFGERTGFYATGHNPTALVANLRYTRVLVRVGDGVPDPRAPAEVRNVFGQAAEIELRSVAQDFLAAARRAGVHVAYQPHKGIHQWRYWRADLRAAIAWGLFRRVTERPRSWTYATVARHAVAWGYTFDFRRSPAALERISLKRCVLRASGAGVVRVTPPSGRPFTASLPFARRLSCR